MKQPTDPNSTGAPVPKADMELYADSRDVARGLGLPHDKVLDILDAPDVVFGDGYGVVRFQTGEPAGAQGAGIARFAYLTEDQVFCFATLAHNTDQSVPFKAALIKAFCASRRALEASLPPPNPSEALEQMVAAKKRAMAAEQKLCEAVEKCSPVSRRRLTKRKPSRRGARR